MYIGLHVKYSLFLSDFNESIIFSIEFRQNPQVSNFMKIRPVTTELFHADGQTDGRTDMKKVIVAFRNFTKAPKTDIVFVMKNFCAHWTVLWYINFYSTILGLVLSIPSMSWGRTSRSDVSQGFSRLNNGKGLLYFRPISLVSIVFIPHQLLRILLLTPKKFLSFYEQICFRCTIYVAWKN